MSPLSDVHEGRDVRVDAMLLGHIRLGIYNGRHPLATETFVFTSVDRQRLEPLAQDFGGEIKPFQAQGAGADTWRLISETTAFDALFPFADLDGNLRQDWMLWKRSGLERLCAGFGYEATVYTVDEENGVREGEVTPCVCEARGEPARPLSARTCEPETRIRLLLAQTGLGIWELHTGSSEASETVHDQMRFIEAAARGQMNHVPVRVVLAAKERSYIDPKDHKRKSRTVRIVQLSPAGDALHLLTGLNMEPNRALLAAVETVLADVGRELPSVGGVRLGGRPDAALPAGSEEEQDGQGEGPTSSESDEGEAPEPEASGLDEGSGAEPDEGSSAGSGVDAPEGPDDGPAEQGDPGPTRRDARPAAGPSFDEQGLTGDPDLDAPAPAQAWDRAGQAGLKAGVALKIARKLWPKAGLRASHQVTKGQLSKVITAYLDGERG